MKDAAYCMRWEGLHIVNMKDSIWRTLHEGLYALYEMEKTLHEELCMKDSAHCMRWKDSTWRTPRIIWDEDSAHCMRWEGLCIMKDSAWRTPHEGLRMKDSAWRTPHQGLHRKLINDRGEGAHSNGPCLSSFGVVVVEINLVEDSCRFLVRTSCSAQQKLRKWPRPRTWVLDLLGLACGVACGVAWGVV